MYPLSIFRVIVKIESKVMKLLLKSMERKQKRRKESFDFMTNPHPRKILKKTFGGDC
jgi:hypothetical protein